MVPYHKLGECFLFLNYSLRYDPRVRGGAVNLERTLVNHADMSIDIMDDIIKDLVREQTVSVVREACSEYVNSHLNLGKPNKTTGGIVDGLTEEVTRSMVNKK